MSDPTQRAPGTPRRPPPEKDGFKRLQQVDAQLSTEGVQAGDPKTIAQAHKVRAKLLATFGVAGLAIKDIDAALVPDDKNPELVAIKGEANRIFARDVLLGGAVKTRTEVIDYVRQQCIPPFEFALAKMQSSSPQWRSWLHAHLAACYTLIVSMRPNDDRNDAAFNEGKKNFEAARALNPNYPWAVQYQAFLYAVRGKDGDFPAARALLHDLKEKAPDLQSSIDRSLSMLYSYDTDHQSLADSVTFGLEAAARDSQDPFALYFAGASMKRLSDPSVPPEFRISPESADAALESARVRATNAISQATALLAVIASLQGHDEVTKAYLAAFAKAPRSLEAAPDLETLTMMSRDHSWDKFRNNPDFHKLMSDGVAPRPKVWWTQSPEEK